MRIVLKIEAIEPISVGFESTGIETSLYRIPIIMPDGDVIDVPIIPGNSLRGVLRDEMAFQFLSDVKKISNKLSVNAGTLMTLFSGGILAGGQEEVTTKKVSEIMDKYVKPLLPLSIMGCALIKMMVPSKIKLGIGYPVTKETKKLVEDIYDGEATVSLADITSFVLMTRKDDKMKMTQLAVKTDFSLLDELLKKGLKGERRAAIQQRFRREVVIPGTLFVTYIDEILPLTPEEWGLLLKTLKRLKGIGGSVARGLGGLKITYSGLSAEEVHKFEEAYRDYVKENQKKIIDALQKDPAKLLSKK